MYHVPNKYMCRTTIARWYLVPGTWYQETDGEGPGYGNIDIMASNKRHIKILGNGNDIYRNVRMMCPYNLQGNIFI